MLYKTAKRFQVKILAALMVGEVPMSLTLLMSAPLSIRQRTLSITPVPLNQLPSEVLSAGACYERQCPLQLDKFLGRANTVLSREKHVVEGEFPPSSVAVADAPAATKMLTHSSSASATALCNGLQL
jgi:hypothetical protein